MQFKPWVGQKVLIVDDSPIVQAYLKEAYAECGMTVVGIAPNGVVALELFRTTKPDLVSLDLIMPEMDGFECYRKLQQEAPGFRCVVISWLANEPKVVEQIGTMMPVHALQGKPVNAQQLLARLEKVYNPPEIAPALENVGDVFEVAARVS